jgi:(5-formylfuran-3-yl)methyl phosphate synthase
MQLLISVKNVEESLLALASGADIVDLKDPNLGALGALDVATSSAIITALNSQKLEQVVISATVGEGHASLSDLVAAVQTRADLGVHLIKIAVSELFYSANFLSEMSRFAQAGLKIVAVFFADERVNFTLLPVLKRAGFYGAMLDTSTKQHNLLQMQSNDDLHLFTHFCHQHHLKSGLAGSLQAQHIDSLAEFSATYIGFRGGICDNFERKSDLSSTKILEVKKLLLAHNKLGAKPQKTLPLALHS